MKINFPAMKEANEIHNTLGMIVDMDILEMKAQKKYSKAAVRTTTIWTIKFYDLLRGVKNKFDKLLLVRGSSEHSQTRWICEYLIENGKVWRKIKILMCLT